ncbi:MAG: hypothetical protein NUW37_19710 [Planctomycetes bacterium]|nr:hypothetical protein [Planctomycetota bacterium]
MKATYLTALLTLVFPSAILAQAESPFRPAQLADVTDSFEQVVRAGGTGTAFDIAGESFLISDREAKPSIEIRLPDLGDTSRYEVTRRYIAWINFASDATWLRDTLKFTDDAGTEFTARCDNIHMNRDEGIVYSAISQLPSDFSGTKMIVIAPDSSRDQSGKYVVCGASVITIYKDRQIRDDSAVRILMGIAKVMPGQPSEVRIDETRENETSPRRLTRLAIVGGHGRACSGSANLLSGQTLGASEAWSGNAGHLFDINNYRISGGNVGPKFTLTFDSLQQIVFPAIIITEMTI